MPLHRGLLALLVAASGSVLASPAPYPAADTTTPALLPTKAWVSVGSDGVAKTITPVLTTVSNTPTVISAEPTTSNTASSSAPPAATATNGAGSFPVCSNADGDFAPFCAPSNGSSLLPGATYYITWDAGYFAFAPNTSVIITGNFFNETTGAVTTQAFSSDPLAAAWSFYSWTVDKALLNRSIRISLSYITTGNGSTHRIGPIVTVANPPPYRQPPAKPPTGAALYIGLPAVICFVALMVIGTCYWNNRTRRIDVGNISSRSRFGKLGELSMGRSRGGYGVGKSRRQRVGAVNLDSKDAIDLQNREAARQAVGRGGSPSHGSNDEGYDDFGMAWSQTDVGRKPASPYADLRAAPGRPRRDSDSLGSLAGTPTDDQFHDAHRAQAVSGQANNGSTGNAFRDELRRQQNNLI
ncbi:hypothetical protein SEPCBS119000_000228 [Sporothrix epigloea]|uniref:Uncharacterized protein n=1 Tax=Sporothrix epigloea TaxID=1892477 RepID=A0ABP0D3Z8_9PEZI